MIVADPNGQYLWMYGGFSLLGNGAAGNELWCFNIATRQWALVSGPVSNHMPTVSKGTFIAPGGSDGPAFFHNGKLHFFMGSSTDGTRFPSGTNFPSFIFTWQYWRATLTVSTYSPSFPVRSSRTSVPFSVEPSARGLLMKRFGVCNLASYTGPFSNQLVTRNEVCCCCCCCCCCSF